MRLDHLLSKDTILGRRKKTFLVRGMNLTSGLRHASAKRLQADRF